MNSCANTGTDVRVLELVLELVVTRKGLMELLLMVRVIVLLAHPSLLAGWLVGLLVVATKTFYNFCSLSRHYINPDVLRRPVK